MLAPERRVTYGELLQNIQACSSGLLLRGVKKGDVVCIFSPNTIEYCVTFHAVISIGAILTTANPTYTATELSHQLKSSGATYIVTVPSFLELVKGCTAEVGGIKEVFVCGDAADGATAFKELLKDGPAEYQSKKAAIRSSINVKVDPVVYPYSSGTTGLPKACKLTAHGLVANICQLGVPGVIEFAEDEVLYTNIIVPTMMCQCWRWCSQRQLQRLQWYSGGGDDKSATTATMTKAMTTTTMTTMATIVRI